jgi:UPF0716 protein FxsA
MGHNGEQAMANGQSSSSPRHPRLRRAPMSLGKWIFIGLLTLPLAEVIAFVLVVIWLGLLPAFVLLVATSVAGVLVLRRAGRARLARFRVAVADSDVTGIQANTGGFLTVLAGILLVLPGFITDVIGALLLIPRVRSWFGATFRRAVHRHERRSGPGSVIDLEPHEWEQLPDTRPDNKRKKKRL